MRLCLHILILQVLFCTGCAGEDAAPLPLSGQSRLDGSNDSSEDLADVADPVDDVVDRAVDLAVEADLSDLEHLADSRDQDASSDPATDSVDTDGREGDAGDLRPRGASAIIVTGGGGLTASARFTAVITAGAPQPAGALHSEHYELVLGLPIVARD